MSLKVYEQSFPSEKVQFDKIHWGIFIRKLAEHSHLSSELDNYLNQELCKEF